MTRRLLLLLLAGLVAGCTTYANIPAEPGSVAISDPNDRAIREIEIEALRAVLAEYPVHGTVEVVLPEGTDGLTYAAVLSALDQPAVSPNRAAATQPAEPQPGPVATLAVRGVRIRNDNAQVDIDRSGVSGLKQLITVYLKRAPFSEWGVRSIRPWGAIRDISLERTIAPPEKP